MNKRRRPSLPVLISLWTVAVLSLLLLVPTGAAVSADAGSFRSCNANSTGLFIQDCGKQSLNGGDLLILGLFIGTLCVVICFFTHAWRVTRRPA